jgi:hypothetical protein
MLLHALAPVTPILEAYHKSHLVVPFTVRPEILEFDTGRTQSYWMVSCNLFGEQNENMCGHKHRTESGAQACAVRVKKRWKAHRSKQAKKNSKKLKADRKGTGTVR